MDSTTQVAPVTSSGPFLRWRAPIGAESRQSERGSVMSGVKSRDRSRTPRREIRCICAGLLMALFVALMGTWPQTAQAQLACTSITQIPAPPHRDPRALLFSAPTINADGTRIAFASQVDSPVDEIFLWDARTGITQITHSPGIADQNFNSSISADGKRIAF